VKPGNQAAILMILGSLLFWPELLSKPLGLPEPIGMISMLGGGSLLWLAIRLQKRAKGEQSPQVIDPNVDFRNRKRRFWIITTAMVAGSVIIMPLLPYIVENFQAGLYAYIIPGQILVIGFLIGLFYYQLLGPARKK
jgi:hypothetical protein